MPTYAYRCAACGHSFDIHQAFTDDALTVCPECGGTLRKVFGSVGVTFKGSGFYRTDSRGSKAGASSDASAKTSSSSSVSDSSGGSSSGSTSGSSSTTSSASGSSPKAASA